MIRDDIENLIKKAIEKAQKEGKLPAFAKAPAGKPRFKIPKIVIEHPEEKSYGDYATNIALILAKTLKKKPIEIAKQIKSEISSNLFEKIEAVEPGFINFFLKPEFLQKQVGEMLRRDKNFGRQDIGKNRIVIIDYSSPNIAKPMHVGHLRSTIIGQAIYNIYKFLGYKVIGDNHLGDWGKQSGIMIAACKKYKVNLKNITIKKMLDIYVRFNKEIEQNLELEDKARKEFKKLEDGNKENRKIWEILEKKSLEEFNKIYQILGIKFDLVLGESFYEKYLKEEIEIALKKRIAVENPDGSVIIPLERFNLSPFLIQKSDGATLYSTRDLATIRYRAKKYNPEKIIYVVGSEQTFHFEQLFHSAKLLGYISCDKLEHIKFGLVLDENRKKLATRAGRVVDARELISKIIDLANKVIKEKNPKLSKKERDKIAQIIGVGAIKYNDLSQNRQTNIVFDWGKMLSFKGSSGPYLQYSYVRLRSILRKAGGLKNLQSKSLKEKEEIEILKELVRFPEIVEEVGEKFQINLLVNYLYNLASSINTFYEKFSVLKAEKDIKSARLALIKAATIVLKNGLNLLGIETLEKM